MDFEIVFNASGTCRQTVVIKKEGITAEQIQRGLEDGTIFTSAEPSGLIMMLETGEVIGKVVTVDNDLSYEQFEVRSIAGD